MVGSSTLHSYWLITSLLLSFRVDPSGNPVEEQSLEQPAPETEKVCFILITLVIYTEFEIPFNREKGSPGADCSVV